MSRRRILFIAEAVTLAHVARPVSLARNLAVEGYEIVMACDPRYAAFASAGPWEMAGVRSIPSAQFSSALASGTPVYQFDTLQDYLEADLRLIDRYQPDLVVGDFRLTLSVSARLIGVPYIAISNAYWMPAFEAVFPLPVLPLSRYLPLPLARPLFSAFSALAFSWHCRPLNRLRQRHGMPGFGCDIRRTYTDADHVLIADAPSLFPMDISAAAASYIGPLPWSPPIEPPLWWRDSIDTDEPEVYVTLGSSGPPEVLSMVLQALSALPLRVIASTAGAPLPANVPANARVAQYLPGDAAVARSNLAVCNGGSLAVQQALAAGIPVLGLASNMDQFLNMAPIVQSRAGLLLRTDRLSVDIIRSACQTLLSSDTATLAAQRLQPALVPNGRHVAAVFNAVAEELLEPDRKLKS